MAQLVRLLVLFVALSSAAAVLGQNPLSQREFLATVSIYNDPSILGGVTGTIYYNYTGAIQRIDYQIGNPPAYNSVNEIIDFGNELRYLRCSRCETETYRRSTPEYFLTTADSALPSTLGLPDSVTVGSRTCQGRVKDIAAQGDGNVFVVYSNTNNQNDVCRVIFDDISQLGFTNPGRYMDFTNNFGLFGSSTFYEFQNWNCPQASCAVKIDMYLVFDESGSINAEQYGQEKTFGIQVVGGYTIGPDHVRIGLTVFGQEGRVWFNLTDDYTTIVNLISSLDKKGGQTCIPCGLELALWGLQRDARPGVGRVIITITDGANNVRTADLQPTIDAVATAGVISFGIGVGSSINQNEIRALGFNITGRYFFSPDFASLSNVLSSLISETCTELPGNPCGQGCRGFCACDQTCLCPTQCVSANQCLQGTCIVGANGNGCIFGNRTCGTSDLCQSGICLPESGCTYQPKTCDDNNPCTSDTCSSSTGCQNRARVCNDNNPCTMDVCNITLGGCDNSTAVPCDLCLNFAGNCSSDVCTLRECRQINNTAVCVESSITTCDDGNACSVDTCTLATGCAYTKLDCDDGDACTRDSCDPQTGCIHTNITSECNDFSLCTADSCNSLYTGTAEPPLGPCVYTPLITCPNSTCATGVCNSVLGCVDRPVSCDSVRLRDGCHYARCEEATGCREVEIPNAARSSCGICQGADEDCPAPPIQTEVVAGVSAGILLLLILGGIAICLALAAFGGKKGYDAFIKGKEAGMNADASPIYDGGNMAGENPYFDDE